MPHQTTTWILSLLFVVHGVQLAAGDDWPQWLGPQRDSVWRESGIVATFPADGPKVVWRAEMGGGYSGPAVADGKVFVMDYVRREGEAVNNPGVRAELSGDERVLCLDAMTGEKIWEHSYDCPYSISYPAGPRVTPTVDNDLVFSLGSEGHLHCLNVSDGSVVWSKDLKTEYETKAPIWGFCGHPLVEGNTLFCLVGGKDSVAVAFDKRTGKEKWRAISASESGYCPPSIITAGGERQLIIWDADQMHGLDPETGDIFWSLPLKPMYGMSIAVPRRSGNFLFASGIGSVAGLVELSDSEPDATMAWEAESRDESIYSANSTPFIEGGTIYGTDCHAGTLIACDLKTGTRHWSTAEPVTGEKAEKHGTAFLVKQGDRFFLFNELGDSIIANLNPERYQEIGRVNLLAPTGEAFGRKVVWSHPAFADRKVFARNDKEMVCVDLAE